MLTKPLLLRLAIFKPFISLFNFSTRYSICIRLLNSLLCSIKLLKVSSVFVILTVKQWEFVICRNVYGSCFKYEISVMGFDRINFNTLCIYIVYSY
uniref:Epigene product n=1 Tax=Drosophila virilis TaxID=7244 RepID=O76327_DROVI|nr:epigene product [Drosophila virilis]